MFPFGRLSVPDAERSCAALRVDVVIERRRRQGACQRAAAPDATTCCFFAHRSEYYAAVFTLVPVDSHNYSTFGGHPFAFEWSMGIMVHVQTCTARLTASLISKPTGKPNLLQAIFHFNYRTHTHTHTETQPQLI